VRLPLILYSVQSDYFINYRFITLVTLDLVLNFIIIHGPNTTHILCGHNAMIIVGLPHENFKMGI